MAGRKKFDWKSGSFLLFGILPSAPACANDGWWFAGGLSAAGEAILAVVAASVIATFIIEGIILQMLLKQGWGRSFGFAIVANIVSAGIGLMWYVAQGGYPGGWKTAFAMREYDRVAFLFLRSYLITVAEETVVIGLTLGKSLPFKTTFKAVAIMNLISYALTFILIALFVK